MTEFRVWRERVDQLRRVGLKTGEAVSQACIEVYGRDCSEEDFYLYDMGMKFAEAR